MIELLEKIELKWLEMCIRIDIFFFKLKRKFKFVK